MIMVSGICMDSLMTMSISHTGRIEPRRLLMSPIIAEYHQYVMNHD